MFIQLNSHKTNAIFWLRADAVFEIGVADFIPLNGVTVIETQSRKQIYVQETPQEVLALIQNALQPIPNPYTTGQPDQPEILPNFPQPPDWISGENVPVKKMTPIEPTDLDQF